MRIVPVLVAMSVLVSACSGDDEAAPTTTQQLASGQIDISLDPVELSDQFPSEIPIPVDLVLLGSEVLDGETTTIFEVTGWHAGESIAIGGEYVAVLEAQGFEITTSSETDDKWFFNAESDDWFVSAGFFPDPIRLQGTSVGITVVPVGT